MLRNFVLTFYALAFSMAAQEPSFQQLAAPLHEFRSVGRSEIAIRFGPTSFRVVRRTESELSPEQARALTAKGTSATLRITRTGLWIAHEISADVTVDEPVAEKGASDTRKWKKRTWGVLGTYGLAEWPQFAEFALANGLSGIEESRYKGSSWFTLSFAPATPDSFDAGGRRINLSADFKAQMRFSPEHPAKAGSQGFVVLLHDPHQNVAGRFQTLAGLRDLALANPSAKFRFLVEGAYHAPSRDIGFGGLDRVIAEARETRAAVTYSLLNRFMINVPLAYRLLYDQKVSAYAIDNNDLLQYDAPPPQRSRFERQTSLSNLAAALRKPNLALSAEGKKQFQEILATALIYTRADLEDVPDDKLVEYYGNLAEMYGAIASVGKQLANAGVSLNASDDFAALAADADSCKARHDEYQKAYDRTKFMGPMIAGQIHPASQELPIVFIGNYHTDGITADLQARGIGYVVIEPRMRESASEEEDRAFGQANHVNVRTQYLSAVHLNMGFNGPTEAEVQQFYLPKIESKIPELRADRLAIQHEFSAVQGSAVDTERLASVMDNNGSLSAVLISSGGNKPPPPGNFGRAFAFAEPGEGGPGGKLHFVLTDPKDSRWQEWDRYNFLRDTPIGTAQERAGVTPGVSETFYQDPGSHRMFFTVYDPQSKRTYYFEGSAQQAVAFVPNPHGAKTGDQDVRIQVVELIGRTRRKNG